MGPLPQKFQDQLESLHDKIPQIHQILYFSEIGSTNAEAVERGHHGAPEGTLIVAETQSAGRGRLNRRWESPAKQGLYFSLLLRPRLPATQVPLVTLAAGMAIAETLRRLGLKELLLKWPNDLMFGKKKLGGILAEMFHGGDGVDFLVLGIGLNVSQAAADFSPELAAFATSLRQATGKDWDRAELLSELVPPIFREVERLAKEGAAPLVSRWEQNSGMIGLKVSFQESGRTSQGRVLGLTADGRLRIQEENQNVTELVAGDTVLL